MKHSEIEKSLQLMKAESATARTLVLVKQALNRSYDLMREPPEIIQAALVMCAVQLAHSLDSDNRILLSRYLVEVGLQLADQESASRH